MRRIRLKLASAIFVIVPALAVLTGLSGCAETTVGFGPHLDGPERIAAERSIIILPRELEARRLAVWREIDQTRLEERVVLANDTAVPRENTLILRTRWRGTPFARLFFGSPNPFTAKRISERLSQEFDGFASVSQPLDRTNRHGPYRYVEAASDGIACVLAWQMVDAIASVTGEIEDYALELRLCAPQADPKQLVALFDQIRVEPDL